MTLHDQKSPRKSGLSLQDAELQHLAEIVRSSDDAIVSKTLDGTITSWNRGAEAMFGYPAHEALGRSITMIMPPEYIPAWLDVMGQVREGEQVAFVEAPRVTRDGRTLHVCTQVFPLRSDSGRIYGAASISRNISDHVRARQAMQRSEERFSTLFRNSPAAIGIGTAEEGRWVDVNDRYASLFGYARQELIGHTVEEMNLWPDIEARRQLIQRLRRDGRLRDVEVRLRHRSGAPLDLLLSMEPLTLSEESLVIVMLIDVTERTRAEEALRNLSGRLLRLQDEERRRIGNALHDTTAQNMAAVAMNLASLASDLRGRQARILRDALQMTEHCMRDIRTLSYLLHPPLLDDVGLVSAMREYVEGFARRSGMQIELALPDTECKLSKDVETSLFRILQEGLANIHRHARSKTASVRLTAGSSELCLEIADRGVGLDLRLLDGPCVGVGIPGMRERLRLLGGVLDIRSSDSGTTLIARMPSSVCG
jgi:PAS domain S-box-containing protein